MYQEKRAKRKTRFCISADEMREHMLLRGYMDDEIDTALKVLDVDGDGQVRLPAPTPHAPFA